MMLWTALLLACNPSGPPPADPQRLLDALGLEVLPRAPLDPRENRPHRFEGYTLRPVSLQVYSDFRVSAALWLPDGPGPHPGVLMAHGHFGQGKSSGEAQGPAHALAARGYAVLAVDTPGVEEGDQPGRRIHMARGAHGRAMLAAAGTSAMATQLHALQAGLDYLEGRGDVGEVAVTGSSGGSVQSFYLLFVDPRPAGAVLASFVPMPREARAGGCACDTVPGWPGPDDALLAAAPRPTLWLSDHPGNRPAGLPRSADYVELPGPHGYEPPMVRAAAEWLDDLLDHDGRGDIPDALPNSPMELLATPDVGAARFPDLLAGAEGAPAWVPAPHRDVPYTVSCEGSGPTVIQAGGGPEDTAALVAAGFEACSLEVAEDESGLAEAIATGGAYADRFAGALGDAVRARGAVGVYAVRAWGVAAQGAGVRYVLRDPVRALREVDEDGDPSWIHTPGIWWRGDPYPDALATGSAPDALVAALGGPSGDFGAGDAPGAHPAAEAGGGG
jgi:dienelactone hydrolase